MYDIAFQKSKTSPQYDPHFNFISQEMSLKVY